MNTIQLINYTVFLDDTCVEKAPVDIRYNIIVLDGLQKIIMGTKFSISSVEKVCMKSVLDRLTGTLGIIRITEQPL